MQDERPLGHKGFCKTDPGNDRPGIFPNYSFLNRPRKDQEEEFKKLQRGWVAICAAIVIALAAAILVFAHVYPQGK